MQRIRMLIGCIISRLFACFIVSSQKKHHAHHLFVLYNDHLCCMHASTAEIYMLTEYENIKLENGVERTVSTVPSTPNLKLFKINFDYN